MRVLIAAILSILMMNCLANSTTCFNIKKLEANAKQLIRPYEDQFCKFQINPKHIAWAINSGLPRLMNKEFLGVEPPPNWEFFAIAITNECYREGDLCSERVQEEFSQCAIAKLPLLLLQFGPWLSENCQILNRTLIKHWKEKKVVAKGMIEDFLREVKGSNE